MPQKNGSGIESNENNQNDKKINSVMMTIFDETAKINTNSIVRKTTTINDEKAELYYFYVDKNICLCFALHTSI